MEKKITLLIIILLLVPILAIAAHYTVNGDGTVTDNVTGLMWQQEDDNIARMYKLAITYCENIDFSTYSDWRLPNRKELSSIIDNSQGEPVIDSAAFPNTDSSHYWSSTTAAPPLAWSVDFSNGNVSYYDKANSRYVRCVRGGQ